MLLPLSTERHSENNHQILLPQPVLAACRLLARFGGVARSGNMYAILLCFMLRVFVVCLFRYTELLQSLRCWLQQHFQSIINDQNFLTQDPIKASARNLPLSHTDQKMFFLGRVISVREPWACLFF